MCCPERTGQKMDCCTRFAKFLLCLFNFVFFVSFIVRKNAPKLVSNSCPVQVVGSVVLILGLWVVVDKYNFLRVTKLDAIIKVTLQ